MSLPSLAQGALEDKVQEIGEEIYMIVEENIDTFIDDTVHEALCSVDPEWGFDPVDFREDVMQSIKQYLSQTVRGVYNVQH